MYCVQVYIVKVREYWVQTGQVIAWLNAWGQFNVPDIAHRCLIQIFVKPLL